LVTPARNEERTIGETLASVVNQTVLPREWIIVSDGSTDGTDRLVADYARTYPFIRLLRLEDRPGRSFASAVFATEAGAKALRFQEYQYLGLLDADVRFAPNYFEALMRRLAASPELGLVGGLALDMVDGRPLWQQQNRSEVAGAVQFYRRACWESLGALFPIRQGGWDAVTCLQARANGYATQTFDDIIVEHLKRRNSADGGALAGSWTFGCRDYALGHHPVFEIAKCAERLIEPPLLVGGLVRLIAFFWCCLALRKSLVPESIVAQVRREQMHRLCLSLLRPLGLVRSVKRVATSMEQIESDRMAHVRQP
jgi:glycosyltransferase involved in cell wall biosynthesis